MTKKANVALVLLIGAAVTAACAEEDLLKAGNRNRGGSEGADGGAEAAGERDKVGGSSAGGKTYVISDGWDIAPIVGGNNVKFLNFNQMKSEVKRATGLDWAEWEANRATFGAADYVTSFQDDRAPSGTKLVIWRKMAYDVCTKMVANTPAVFTAIAPTAPIASTDPKVSAQVTILATRFFQDDPGADLVSRSLTMLQEAVAAGGKPTEAWTGLCVAYLASSRFMTY